MNRINALLKLTRIEHSAILVIAVIAAEVLAGMAGLKLFELIGTAALALSVITPVFISMGSFAINDYYDVEADKVNKRTERPLVNGSLTKNQALWVAILCFAIGISASFFINAYAFIIALAFGILAVAYSYKLKDTLLLGNIYIAFSMVIPFIYGNYVVTGSLEKSIIVISIVIFLAGLAREIHGMIRDYKGDAKARKSKNLVRYIGARRSAQLAFLLYAEAILVSAFIFFFVRPYEFNLVYAVPIAAVDVVLAYIATCYLFQKTSDRFSKFARNARLAAMALALIAFLIAALAFVPLVF